jgi:hypothetical protein
MRMRMRMASFACLDTTVLASTYRKLWSQVDVLSMESESTLR